MTQIRLKTDLPVCRAFIELATVPLWITEVVPPKDRGMLIDLHPIFANIGYVVASYVGVGFFYFKTAAGNEWRAPLALGCLPCILCLISLPFVPESPRWLLLQGRREEAWNIVQSLHHSPNTSDTSFAEQEFYLMREQTEYERTHRISFMELLRSPAYRKRLAIGCGLPFLLQSSGVLVINSKSNSTLPQELRKTRADTCKKITEPSYTAGSASTRSNSCTCRPAGSPSPSSSTARPC